MTFGSGLPTRTALKIASLPKDRATKQATLATKQSELDGLEKNTVYTFLDCQSDGFAGEVWSAGALRDLLHILGDHDSGHT